MVFKMSVEHEFNTFVTKLIEAIDLLVERKEPLTMAPINELKERIQSPTTVRLETSYIIRKLVEAGYNIGDIKDFFLDAGIIRDTDEWIKLKIDVERAIIMTKIEEERGGI